MPSLIAERSEWKEDVLAFADELNTSCEGDYRSATAGNGGGIRKTTLRVLVSNDRTAFPAHSQSQRRLQSVSGPRQLPGLRFGCVGVVGDGHIACVSGAARRNQTRSPLVISTWPMSSRMRASCHRLSWGPWKGIRTRKTGIVAWRHWIGSALCQSCSRQSKRRSMLVVVVDESEKRRESEVGEYWASICRRLNHRPGWDQLSQEGLQQLRDEVGEVASKTSAICCFRIRTSVRYEVVWMVGNVACWSDLGWICFKEHHVDSAIW